MLNIRNNSSAAAYRGNRNSQVASRLRCRTALSGRFRPNSKCDGMAFFLQFHNLTQITMPCPDFKLISPNRLGKVRRAWREMACSRNREKSDGARSVPEFLRIRLQRNNSLRQILAVYRSGKRDLPDLLNREFVDIKRELVVRGIDRATDGLQPFVCRPVERTKTVG